jgi:hypothetical protein
MSQQIALEQNYTNSQKVTQDSVVASGPAGSEKTSGGPELDMKDRDLLGL